MIIGSVFLISFADSDKPLVDEVVDINKKVE
jgi:hypothetical protein